MQNNAFASLLVALLNLLNQSDGSRSAQDKSPVPRPF
jgi:hypothetical protein